MHTLRFWLKLKLHKNDKHKILSNPAGYHVVGYTAFQMYVEFFCRYTKNLFNYKTLHFYDITADTILKGTKHLNVCSFPMFHVGVYEENWQKSTVSNNSIDVSKHSG